MKSIILNSILFIPKFCLQVKTLSFLLVDISCKYIYDRFPEAQHLLATHGRLRGLVNAFPYLQLDGGIHGGTYILCVNSELFEKLI